MGGGELEDSTVEECRTLLEADSPILNEKFKVWYGINIDSRLAVFENGIVELAFDIIRKNSTNHLLAIKEAWRMFSEIVIVFDVEDDQEYIPIEKLVGMGLIPMMALEFERRRLENKGLEMLHALSWCASRECAIEPIMQADVVHKYAISVIKIGPPHEAYDTSMSLIRSLSASSSAQIKTKLRADGALDVVLPFVDNLKHSNNDEKIKQGYRSASIVARLAGNDEAGIGPKILHGNPLVITKSVEILDRALDAGPKSSVINMRVNPHNITMDLLTISTSDANKLLLKDSIPILIKALRVRGETNEEMVVDIVKTLLQLTFDKECRRVMENNKDELIEMIQSLVVPSKYDMEAMIAAANLVNVLSTRLQQPAPSAGAGKPGRLAVLFRKAVKESNASSTENANGPRLSINITAPSDKHVMLSYNWRIKPLVHRVDELLRANGIKTWLDDRDMGPNLNDSMAQAIEGAYVVFAFMTRDYKESANCRKECEYADDCKIPIVYIMAEEGYKPNGWLGLQLGKAVWIACWQMEMVDQNLPKLLQHAKSSRTTNGEGADSNKHKSSAVNTLPSNLPSSNAVSSNTGSFPPEFVSMLTSMKAQLDFMAIELEKLRYEQAELKTNHASLQNAFLTIQKKIDEGINSVGTN